VAIAAAATLATGGALLVCGKPRAGMVAAVSGAALAMLDQQETVSAWWSALPNYLAQIQDVLARVQETLDDISVQRDRLHRTLTE
jgi:HPt (histidine-containing phosphotransfer) domain-containing protein